MYYHPKRLPSNEDRIYKQRQYEDARRVQQESVDQYAHLMLCAEFEQANEPRIKYRSYNEREEALRKQKERELAEKRRRLAALLEEEQSLLQTELRTTTMNLAERRAWLEARARALKQRRQNRDKTYSEEQLERLFEESCDDVRLHNSRMAVLRAEEIRKKQREENVRRKMQEAANQKTEKELLEMEWKREEEERLQEIAKKALMKQEAMDILKEQICMVQVLRDDERRVAEEEMRQLVRKWQMEEDELREQQYHQRCLDQQKAQEMLEYNELCEAEKRKEVDQEKEFDAHLVVMATQREAMEEQEERELKEAHRREAMRYAEYLKKLMARQVSSEQEIEAMVKRETEAEWKRKDEETQCQEEKRQRLLNRVNEERLEQLRYKESIREAAEAAKREELEKINADLQAMELERERIALEAQMSKQDLCQALEGQMRGKQAASVAAKQQKQSEFEGGQTEEKKYEEKVARSLTLPHPEPKHGRKNAQWFF